MEKSKNDRTSILAAKFCLLIMVLQMCSNFARALDWDEMQEYSDSPEVGRMINIAMRNRQAHPTGHCYHYVKRAVYTGYLARNGSLGGGYAVMAVKDLESQGFRNILNDMIEESGYDYRMSERAPIGSILVFAGDWHYRAGDVAIKTKTGYVSDYYSPRPITEQWNGAHFRLIGVMTKAPKSDRYQEPEPMDQNQILNQDQIQDPNQIQDQYQNTYVDGVEVNL